MRLTSIIVLLVFFSCKKKESVNAPSATTPSSTPTETFTPQFMESTDFGALFVSTLDTLDNSLFQGPPWNYTIVPTTYTNKASIKNLTSITHSISINDITLKPTYWLTPHPYPNSFEDTTHARIGSQFIWSINTSTSFPGFTENYQTSYPQFFNLNIPDTFFKSKNITFNLSGINNVDQIVINFPNGGTRYYAGHLNQITIPKSFISNESTGIVNLKITFQRRKIKPNGSENVAFYVQCTYSKLVQLMN